MSDIFRDFDKKNEFPKVKIDIGKTLKQIDKITDEMLNYNPANSIFEKIAKDIKEREDNVKAMEFTKSIGELLVKNGVKVKMTEYTRDFENGNTFETRYGVSIDDLDFAEHDKPFEKRIKLLQEENRKLYNQLMETEKDYQAEVERLNQHIAELDNCKKEPKMDMDRPSTEWYEHG